MDFTPVKNYIEGYYRAEKGVPACEIKVMQEHKPLFRYSSGKADYEGTKELTENSIYYLYSCTKPITVTAAMQLVEKGLLELDEPVSKYIPSFDDVFLMVDGQKVRPKNVMTIRHLFTMSGGLDYNFKADHIKEYTNANPDATTREVVDTFVQAPLLFEPGERFKYSLCHDVLAAVIEVITGKSFGEYLKENIFEPLGMKRIGFFVPEDEKADLVAQYTNKEGWGIVPRENNCEFCLSNKYESGGAGLYSTLDDYSIFADALANGGVGITGNRILKAETIDEMRKEQLRAFAVDTQFSCATGVGYGYGLGVRTLIDRSEGQRSAIGEFGWDGAAGSYLLVDPASKLSITFTMHLRNWPKLIGNGHANLRDIVYDVLGI